MPKVSNARNVVFDGRKTGYVPPSKLSISPRLKLHRKQARRIDPITYEVIRHALWHVNEEHGATIQRLSGSPVAMYALDLNPSILTEDGEFVYFGPYMQYMSGVTDTQVKWVLEYRSENPGIRDGDMFLANDPWVGAAHQQDVMLICPVFWKGELFCWVTNCLHQYDLGGITPSSFCGSAENAFQEGICIPPVKIVEGNVIRRDIEELYLRSSRKPEAVALDFRAQLAGNITARDRVHSLIRRYGPNVVKGVMKRIIDNAEAAFLNKLKRLPDGVWRERSYVECCRPGDRRTHRVMLTLRKKGTSLVFENEGTAPQDGAMNATYSGWRGSIMVAVNELLCWDQYFCIGGALRHIDFDPTPGTFNCADFPASVSTAPIQAMEISLYPAYNVLSKMIHSDAELRKDIMCIGGTSQWPATIFRGIDQWGERYGYILVDPIGGAIGAFATGDGISTGGQSRTPICKLPNVEHTEQTFPLLFLYRKEVVDSGGAGRYRGGLSAESCFIPHRAEAITHDTLSSGNAIPTSPGLMGGYPAATNAYKFRRGSDVLERFAERHIPDDIAEMKGEDVTLGLRQENFRQEPSDVYAVVWSAAGGFGDPLERDPDKVRADVIEDRCVSLSAAREIYGVVITSEGAVDSDATGKLRSARRVANRNTDGSVVRLRGTVLSRLTDSLDLRREKDGVHIACSRCAADLGSARGNYKDRCKRRDCAITEANPNIGDYRRYIDDRPVFRQFFCPGCGALIENEVARDSDLVLHDIELHMPSSPRKRGPSVFRRATLDSRLRGNDNKS
ncbi:MAG TPA: hydantoinase B/oxoprolinase family protein [Casimicrobiaceae bacterium]|nr:hydantoinase B/oxoprolinase family protein [Casimicrobiaceae bacterium]